jgi:class 3 adenylate cyclase/tetratricopeptide (TPR) repeat protein
VRSLRTYTPKHLSDQVIGSRGALEGERKQVTVMFCDIANSTAMAERMGADAMHRVLNEFFDLALPEVHRHEGTVNQFLGDGFMALFGAPISHEDHARRATLAAVGLQKKLHERLSGTPGAELSVRIGINTGPVVVGTIGDDLRMDYTAVGDTTNLAARLERLAEPGAVFLSRTAYEAVQDYFECEPLRPRKVKGIAHAVQAYRVLAPKSDTEAIASSQRRRFRPVLVGREAETIAFSAQVDRLERGVGSRVAIVGDPGIGKSRFVLEMRRLSEARGLRWVEGRAHSNGDAVGYLPFLQAIRAIAGITDRDSDLEAFGKLEGAVEPLFGEHRAEVSPYLGRLLGLTMPERYESRLVYMDGDAVRGQIFRALRRFFERLSQPRGLVLVLEDWHWADQTSREVLGHLLPILGSAPLLVCVVSRPDAGAGPVAAAAGEVPEEQRIVLGPLSRPQGERLLTSLLGGEIAPQLCERLLDRSGGNPFFLEELARVLRDMGALLKDPATGAWSTTVPLDQLPVPGSLQGVIMARVDRLPDAVKHVVKVASVIGRSFFYPVLSALADKDGALDRHVDELVQLELVRKRGEGRSNEYVFSHALVQEAAYGSILTERRKELHKLVGDCIEIVFADRIDEMFGSLAFHYAQAESWEKAQAYLFKAGDQAGRVAADVEALRHYHQALAAYARVFGRKWDPIQRAMLYRKMGEALFRRGDHHQALDYLTQALDSLGIPYPRSRLGVRLGIVRELLVQLGRRFSRKDWLLGSGSGAGHAHGEEESRIYDALGWITYFVDQELFALGTLRLLNSSEDSGVVTGRVSSSMAFGVILDQVPALKLSRRYHFRGMQLAERTGHPVALAFAHFGFGLHEHHAEGNVQGALAHYTAAAAAYFDSGDFRRWGCSMYFSGWLLRLRGEVGRSAQIHEDLIRAGQDAGDHHVWGWGLQGLGRTMWQIGKPEAGIPYLEKAIELFESVPDYQLVVCASGDLGQCCLSLGEVARAAAVLERGRDMIESRRFRGPFCTEARNALAETYLMLCDQEARSPHRHAVLERARTACTMALRQARVCPEGLPSACRLQGTLEWLESRRSHAQAWWRRGIAAAERIGAPYELGRIYRELGRRTEAPAYLERSESVFATIARGGSDASGSKLLPPRSSNHECN